MSMNTMEQNIRNYLKTLTTEELANSVYLFGVDFDAVSMDEIMLSLQALYNEVVILKDIVDRDFKQKDGEYVRLPEDPETKSIMIRDCYCKSSALRKALSNSDVYNAFVSYQKSLKEKTIEPKF